VESKDVDKHRRHRCHRQWNVTVDQQKYTCDDLKREDQTKVMLDIEGTHELSSNARRWGKGNEVQEAIQPHNKKDHARQIQPANTAVTVYWKNGKVAVTDGPYAETKEQLGGILVLEARDLNHAIQLISQDPGVKLKCGRIEIRPAADLNEMMRESERRRRKDTSR